MSEGSRILWNKKVFRHKRWWYIHLPEHHFASKRGLVPYHRYVYEESRNCCLLPWVDIHHLDDNPSNNEWYNLIPLLHGKHTIISHKGKKESEETRLRFSQVRKGMKMSEEFKRKRSIIMQGNTISKGTKVWLGRKHKEESKRKMSISKSKIRIDMSNRKCSLCGNNKTHIRKGRPVWKHIDDTHFLCNICAQRESKKKKDLGIDFETGI